MECLWGDADSQEKIIPVDTPFARFPLDSDLGRFDGVAGTRQPPPRKMFWSLSHTHQL